MKLLILRNGAGIGGAEIYNLNLFKGFRRYYPEIELLFLTANFNFYKLLKEIGARTVYLPVFNEEVGSKRGLLRFFLVFPRYLFSYMRQILYLRFKEKIGHVFIQSLTEKIFLTPLLKILKFRVIWLEHGPVFTFKTSKISLCLYSLVSNYVDRIVAVSIDAQEDLFKNNIKKEKVGFIYTGVDTEYFRPQKNQKKYYTIGYFGNLVKEKGIKDFINVGNLILLKKKNVKFILGGYGNLTIKNKSFFTLGFQKDIRPYLENFSVYFFPTKHLEGLSLGILEAMAMGIPVVARDIGGNCELVINNKTGILFKNETHEELAEILINLLHDKKRREEMGRQARKLIVEKFNQKIWIDKIYRLFQ
jgi:glycosyltransferase involved in cell wall biosynthesis